MIDQTLARIKCPVYAGLFLLLLALSGCETAKSPDQVTRAFWTAVIDNDLEKAEGYATADSRSLVTSSTRDYSQIASLETGKVIIDGNAASVETVLNPQDETVAPRAFLTELVVENELWRVDFRRTQNNMTGMLFDGFFKGLHNLGEKLQKQFEKQMPLLEKEIESFGEELEKQMEEFGRQLEKKLPPKQPEQRPDTI